MKQFFRVAGTAAILLSSPWALAETVVLTPIKDNTLFEENGSLSNGAGQYFFTGRTQVGPTRRAVFAFDVAGSIPHGSLITCVELTLTMNLTIAGVQTVSLHRLTADWGEGTSVGAMGEGGGAPATPGDATWIYRFYPTAFWLTGGGDFVATSSASAPVDQFGAYQWSSPGMVADVQGWLDDPGSEFGWILVGGEDQTPPAGGNLTLSWGASCLASDSDYEIYEGAIGGNFTSHLPLACSTVGARAVTIVPSAGRRYYLVVPRNATQEGSYGNRSGGAPRLPSGAACLAQSVACCP